MNILFVFFLYVSAPHLQAFLSDMSNIFHLYLLSSKIKNVREFDRKSSPDYL